ncbi:hypothetical protein GCM10010172_39270 [Paractinoplanes ferrugineus]|uniref:Uncharacterized protein n=1 Tax=Paractinoplanes ferrugineus TaxID=113564 RepID=A0A919J4A3_9ACTN|nr:hypothetical protein [Actinoplanes ferrugineus]GIE12703.1 hypothetical protein Afe05nite_45430 [Actinoplanes ferrugineus]
MLQYLLGAVAVAWGVALAVLDQPAVSGRNLNRLCVALLGGGAVLAVAGAVTAALY